jgi:hypothetical protein
MARITRHEWLLAFGAALCSGLFSACQHTGGEKRIASREGPQDAAFTGRSLATDPGGPRPKAVNPGDGSPTDGPNRPPVPPAPPENEPGGPHLRQNTYPPPAEEAARGPEQTPPARTSQSPPAPEARPGPTAANPVEKPAPEVPLVAALRCFLEKRPAEAVALLRQYDKPNQEVLLCLLPLAARLAGDSLDRAKPRDLTAFVEQLQNLEVPLRPRAELVIDKLVFCERIAGFGQYKPLPEGHAFRAPVGGRQGELVQVYAEVSNLASTLRDGAYETRVASSVHIYPADGVKPELREWGYDFTDRNRPIRSLTLRRDFFNNYSFYVPHLPPGNYKLTIRVIDMLTARSADKTLDFRVTTLPGRGEE